MNLAQAAFLSSDLKTGVADWWLQNSWSEPCQNVSFQLMNEVHEDQLHLVSNRDLNLCHYDLVYWALTAPVKSYVKTSIIAMYLLALEIVFPQIIPYWVWWHAILLPKCEKNMSSQICSFEMYTWWVWELRSFSFPYDSSLVWLCLVYEAPENVRIAIFSMVWGMLRIMHAVCNQKLRVPWKFQENNKW